MFTTFWHHCESETVDYVLLHRNVHFLFCRKSKKENCTLLASNLPTPARHKPVFREKKVQFIGRPGIKEEFHTQQPNGVPEETPLHSFGRKCYAILFIFVPGIRRISSSMQMINAICLLKSYRFTRLLCRMRMNKLSMVLFLSFESIAIIDFRSLSLALTFLVLVRSLSVPRIRIVVCRRTHSSFAEHFYLKIPFTALSQSGMRVDARVDCTLLVCALRRNFIRLNTFHFDLVLFFLAVFSSFFPKNSILLTTASQLQPFVGIVVVVVIIVPITSSFNTNGIIVRR